MHTAAKLCCAVSLSLTCLCAFAQLRYEQPIGDHESMWSFKGSKLECVLSYSISDYGRADFVRYSGSTKPLSVELFPKREITDYTTLRFIAGGPAWRGDLSEKQVGAIKLFTGFNPWAGEIVATRLLTYLEQGYMIYMPYSGAAHTNNQLIVPTLSPIGFKGPFQEFLDCSDNLINLNFEAVQLKALLFKRGTTELIPVSEGEFQDQLTYLGIDDSIAFIDVSAFASDSSSNEQNLELARQRAEAIRQRLIDAGVSEEIIHTRSYGSSQATSSTLIDSERSHSARAIVRMERDGSLADYSREINLPQVGVEEQ